VDRSIDPERVLLRAEDAARAAADIAQSVVSSLERLAVTYRQLAAATRNRVRAEKLVEYADQAEQRATRERAKRHGGGPS
jgi:hypothetical protein